jgi:hypothetical protein
MKFIFGAKKAVKKKLVFKKKKLSKKEQEKEASKRRLVPVSELENDTIYGVGRYGNGRVDYFQATGKEIKANKSRLRDYWVVYQVDPYNCSLVKREFIVDTGEETCPYIHVIPWDSRENPPIFSEELEIKPTHKYDFDYIEIGRPTSQQTIDRIKELRRKRWRKGLYFGDYNVYGKLRFRIPKKKPQRKAVKNFRFKFSKL